MMRIAFIIALASLVSVAQSQERIARLDNSVRVEYHYAYTSDFTYDSGSFDLGHTTSHALVLSGA